MLCIHTLDIEFLKVERLIVNKMHIYPMNVGNQVILLALCFVAVSNSSSPIPPVRNPVVQTANGRVRGYTETGMNGRQFYAFKGIPFAKPPIGNLRFESPQKPDNWTGILDAQHDPPCCIQKNYLQGRSLQGSEDCLYINVYVPKNVKYSKPLPVMVFIFWGGYFAGYPTPDYIGPKYLLERRDVILVTMGYRLGVLGFLSTGDYNAPGNYGLKDQSAALKWVQQNIKHFSGDSNSVTLFGQSSGACSVHFHMLSPLSRGLFHRAITQSGTALAIWGKNEGPGQRALAQTQGKFVGCTNTEDNGALIECLRKVPADELVESGDLFKTFAIDPLVVYIPTVENKTAKNPEPFVTKSAAEYIRAKEFMNVPWIIGIVQAEGRLRAQALITQKATREALNKDFDNIMRSILLLSGSHSNTSFLWNELKKFYLNGKTGINLNDSSTFKGLVDLYSDRLFSYNAFQAAVFHRMQGHRNIWFYNFNYTGQYSYGPTFAPGGEAIDYDWEASHCDDLLYLFDSPALFGPLRHPRDIAVKTFMTDSFINLAEFGDPNGNNPKIIWQETNKNKVTFDKNIRYLDIQGDWKTSEPTYQIKDGLNEERWNFLEQLPLTENIADLGQNQIYLS